MLVQSTGSSAGTNQPATTSPLSMVGFDQRLRENTSQLAELVKKNLECMMVLQYCFCNLEPITIVQLFKGGGLVGSFSGLSLEKACQDNPELLSTLKKIPGNFFKDSLLSGSFFECDQAKLLLKICDFGFGEEETKSTQKIIALQKHLFPNGLDYENFKVEKNTTVQPSKSQKTFPGHGISIQNQIQLARKIASGESPVGGTKVPPAQPSKKNSSVVKQISTEDKEKLDRAAELLNGDGDDVTEAFKIFSDLAQSGYVPAMYKLGKMYMDGIGVFQDKKSGIEWLEKASRQKHPEAFNYLKDLENEGNYGQSIAVQQSAERFADVTAHFRTAELRKVSYTKVEMQHFEALSQVLKILAREVGSIVGYEFEERLTGGYDEKSGDAVGSLGYIFLLFPARVADSKKASREVIDADGMQATVLMEKLNKEFGSTLVIKHNLRKLGQRRCLYLDPKQLCIDKSKHVFLNYSCSQFQAYDRPGWKEQDLDPTIIFPYAKYQNKLDINEKNLQEFLCVINEVTINTQYPHRKNTVGVHRPNHNGTHSARQLKTFEYALGKIESYGNPTAQKLLKELTPDQILAAKLAVFMCRAGRVDETSEMTKRGTPDVILKRSAQLFELYARQTNLPENVIKDTVKMMEKIYDLDSSSVFTEAQLMLMNFMKAAHNLDLYRCSNPGKMEVEENWARLSITPYFHNGEEILQGMITYSKNLLTVTGVNIKEHCGYVNDIYKTCSNNMALCLRKVSGVSTDLKSPLLPLDVPPNPSKNK